MQQTLTYIAGILMFAGDIPYILAVTRKQIRPAKASWIIWASLDTIAFAGLIAKHAVNGQMIGTVAGAWFVVRVVLKYGESGWTVLDKFCLFGATLGIGLWIAFQEAFFGIYISLAVIFLGSIPTFVSAWKNPAHENRLAWTLYWLSCVTAMFALPSWEPVDSAQPITFTVIESIMMILLFLRPRKT